MGALYEIASTPAVYAMPAYYDRHRPARSMPPVSIPFGAHGLQHCVLWEPAEVAHEATVFWFHGGGYLVGTPESMANAADVYNAQGYRFCSVGFRLMPGSRFPAQVDDAFDGVRAGLAWLEAHDRPCGRIVVGGSSAGGMSAALVAYGARLQEEHGFDASVVAGFVSCAAVLDADDMLLSPVPPGPAGTVVFDALLDRDALGLRRDLGNERRAVHEALLPYSPIALVDESSRVPSFGVHGTADTASPYATEKAFAERIAQVGGAGAATLCTVDDLRWQHMVTTVTMHKRKVEGDPVLGALFAWLEGVAG